MLCPNLPPKSKKERTPHTAKARLMPPRTQFHLCFTTENRLRHATQTSKLNAMAIIINPYPNNLSMSSHNTYNKTTITTIKISLRTIGEAMKLKNRFHAGWLSFAFRPDLAPLFVLATAYAPEINSQKSTLSGH
jgi:hypothetical protein